MDKVPASFRAKRGERERRRSRAPSPPLLSFSRFRKSSRIPKLSQTSKSISGVWKRLAILGSPWKCLETFWMSIWPIGRLADRRVGRLPNCPIANWPSGQLVSWAVGPQPKRPTGQMPSWPCGGLATWPIAEWAIGQFGRWASWPREQLGSGV